MPNIINTIIPCYEICKNGVDIEMWTIPQIIDEPGVGPNISNYLTFFIFNLQNFTTMSFIILGADGRDLAQLGGGLVGVAKADEGVISGLTNLNNQFYTLLRAPVFLSNGTVICKQLKYLH